MICTSRGIALRQVLEEDLPFLFRLFADPSRGHLWMRTQWVYDEREFRDAWATWLGSLIGAKFIVASGGRPIGLVLEYDRAVEHGHTKVGALLHEESVGHGGGMVAGALLIDYLFQTLPLRKVYLEVFGYNPRVVAILGKLGLPQEGLLKGDRFWDGSYWDLHIFAVYREAWPGVRARILGVERPGAQTGAGVPNGAGKEVSASDLRIPADGCWDGTG
jgi:RimJ/RimL family protein N-acetyltransferase